MASFTYDKRFLQLPTVRDHQMNDIVCNAVKIGMTVPDPEIQTLKMMTSIALCDEDHPIYGADAVRRVMGNASPRDIFTDADRKRYQFFQEKPSRVEPGQEHESGVVPLLYLEIYKALNGLGVRDGIKVVTGDSMMTMHSSKHQAHVCPDSAFTGNSEINFAERLFSPKVTNMSDD